MDVAALTEELTIQKVILDSLQNETFEGVEEERFEIRQEIDRLKKLLRFTKPRDHADGKAACSACFACCTSSDTCWWMRIDQTDRANAPSRSAHKASRQPDACWAISRYEPFVFHFVSSVAWWFCASLLFVSLLSSFYLDLRLSHMTLFNPPFSTCLCHRTSVFRSCS